MKNAWSLGILFFASIGFASFETDVRPYSVVGKGIDGMRIVKSLPSDNGLRKLGVKKNDVVIAVDFEDIHNLHAAMAAYNNKKPKAVTVLRNGKNIALGGKK